MECKLCIQVEVMVCAVSVLVTIVAGILPELPHISCGVSHTNSVHDHHSFVLVFDKHQHDVFVDICSGSAAMDYLEVQSIIFQLLLCSER